MNILNDLPFNPEKPAVLAIKKTERLNLLAVGLLKNQLLAKHKTVFPTMLIVLKGAINFMIEGQEIELKAFETYQIPVNVMHEVLGMEEKNVFTLTIEK